MKPRLLNLAINGLRRDWHAGEIQLIAIAIVIAIASLTTVNFFTDRVKRATETQASELLAADLVLMSSRPIEADINEMAASLDLVRSFTTSFRSMVVNEDRFQMAEVKAVDNHYPIRGKLRTSSALFSAESIENGIPGTGEVWPDARLLQLLGLETGEYIRLGNSEFRIGKILNYEPDRGGDVFNIAPRLLMNAADVESTGLILPGSRVRYRLLLGGAEENIASLRNSIEGREGVRVQGIRDARPELRTALERAEQFLGLAVLVSIALAGLAVAMSSQRYAIRHFDTCAIMRCLGAEQKAITQIFLLQLLLLSVIAGIVGVSIGYLAQHGLSVLMSGLTSAELPAPSFRPVVNGLLASIVTACGFAMPQLLRLSRVSPLRVLRRDLIPVSTAGRVSYGAAVLALAALTPWQSGNVQLTLYTLGGLIVTAILLVLIARLLINSMSRLRSRVGVAWRYGFSNVARRANLSVAQILAIGLGVMVMLLLTLVRTDLLENWRNRLPEGTPNYFLINIQPADVEALQSFLKQHGEVSNDIYPMIRGRLVAINDQSIGADDYEDARAKRLVTREFNLSFAEELQGENRLESGRWWNENDTASLFSVEKELADTLGIKLNDTLTYNIAGEEIKGKVENLRWVEWDSFNVNFFVIANPGLINDYPATYITSFHLPADKRQILSQLLKDFPSVTIFDIDALLREVRAIMEQVVRTVEFVFLFTLMAGVVVLLAAIQTTHAERNYEAGLLSSIGASQKQIVASLSAEFFTLGMISGILAAFAATVIELALAEFVFKIDISINPWVWLIAPIVCTVIIVAGGLLGTRSALREPPMKVLRSY